MNLEQLIHLILALSETPLTRIRLAKTIYFVHKDLVRKKLANLNDITYIRLPLGPSPENLTNIALAQPDIVVENTPLDLPYEKESYSLKSDARESTLKNFSPEIIKSAQNTLNLLKPHPNLELVLASRDPSWMAHHNGESYHLTPPDLKNPFPNTQLRFKIHSKPIANEIGALQAALLRGMLADIVKESTDLEYPNQNASPSAGDVDSLKLHRFTIKLPNWPKNKKKDKSS